MGGGSAVAAVCLEGSLCNIPIYGYNEEQLYWF